MFLPLKLMSQKTKKIKYLVISIVIVSLIVVVGVVLVTSSNSCGISHVGILNDISKYHDTLDPEFCESLVYRIDEFNEQCSQEIEILDCG